MRLTRLARLTRTTRTMRTLSWLGLAMVGSVAAAERPRECAVPDPPLLLLGAVSDFLEDPGRTSTVIRLSRDRSWLRTDLRNEPFSPKPALTTLDEGTVPPASFTRLRSLLAAARISSAPDCRITFSPAGILQFRVVWCGLGGRGNTILSGESDALPPCSPEYEEVLNDEALVNGQ